LAYVETITELDTRRLDEEAYAQMPTRLKVNYFHCAKCGRIVKRTAKGELKSCPFCTEKKDR